VQSGKFAVYLKVLSVMIVVQPSKSTELQSSSTGHLFYSILAINHIHFNDMNRRVALLVHLLLPEEEEVFTFLSLYTFSQFSHFQNY